jgi:hypothetical protein
LLETVRAAGEDRFLRPSGLPAPPPLEELLQRMQDALAASVDGLTVRDLATGLARGALGDDAAPVRRGAIARVPSAR